MKTIKHSAVQRKALPKTPPTPWPLPQDGFETEIARWCYKATGSREAGAWVYTIRVTRAGGNSGQSGTVISLYAYRFRENCVTQHPSDRQLLFCGRGPELLFFGRSKKLPDELLSAFKTFADQVRNEAEEDRSQYQTEGVELSSGGMESSW